MHKNMKTKYIIIGIVILGLAGFGYWAISPLFRNIKANDALPASTLAPVQPSAPQEGATNPANTQSAPQAPIVTSAAAVTGTLGHPASGSVRIIESDGKRYVRYENFKTINGPDIYVYLSKDIDAKDFVSLGKVRATEGNINYEIPPNIDTHDYPYVLTWCKTFSVLFNSAKVY